MMLLSMDIVTPSKIASIRLHSSYVPSLFLVPVHPKYLPSVPSSMLR